MNKHFVYFLSFVFGLMMLSNTASAQYALSGTCGRRIQFNDDSTNLQWSVDTVQRVLTITGNGRMYDYDMDTKAPWYPWRNKIYVLSIGDGVTHIGSYAMYYLEQMDSIRWGNAVITIRENAFNHCTKLRNAIFPFNLESIESYAFYDCSNLRIVKTGNKLRTIGSYAFRYCSRIQTIDFGDAPVVIGNRSFYNSQSLKSLRGSRIKSIDNYAFYNCDSLECLFLGDSLLRINSCAFYGCHSLRGLHLPSTLTTIGGDCFAYAYVLDTITVDPANTIYNSNDNCNAVMQTSNNTLVLGCRRTIIPSLTLSIGSYAFCGCVGLQSVALPNGLVSIGNNAFNGCSSLLTVNLPNSVTTVDCDAFDNCSSLLNPIFNSKLFARLPHNYHGIYTIPESIEIVCCGAFRNCDNLTSVSVPLSVSAVKNYAFYDCDSLLSVTLPDSLASLGSYAFRNCRTLSSISIPSLVRRIESYTFENCSKLQNATLSDSLRTIDSYAFQNCTVLPSIVIPDKVTEINTFAFRYCSALTSITFPASLSRLGRGVIEGCTNLSTIIWNVKHSTISTDDTNHPFTGVRPQISNFVFGDSVRVLPGYLCYNMTNLTSLSLGCNMDSIGEKVFEGCRGIKTIYWNVRNYKDPIIYSKAPFYGIRDSVNSFIFGDSVQHIPAYICHGMSRLHKVYIPAKVSSIGDYAFRYLGVLDSISVDPANTHYDSRGGCNALMETSTNLLMLGCYKTQIPTNTQGIDAYAFRNVRNLPTVTLPPSVTFVGKEAFNGCVDLKNLTLSNNIGTINDYAFQDCDSLYGVTLPDSLWFIGLRAFANCSHIFRTSGYPRNDIYWHVLSYLRAMPEHHRLPQRSCLARFRHTCRGTLLQYTHRPSERLFFRARIYSSTARL